MTAKPDEKGLLADTNRLAVETELIYILTELVQNRKWNDDKSCGKFVFATFDTQGKRYLVIGYNHFRTRDSIKKEHTLFNWRSNEMGGEATIGTRGYGAKLLSFKIGGQYSNYYHLNNSDTFPTDLNEWGLKESINITKLQEKLNSEENIESFINQYRENYIEPALSKDGVQPTLLVDTKFISSPLYSFFRENNFKYFYVFSNYDTQIDVSLEQTLLRLATLYECNTAEIYHSKDLKEPVLKTPSVENSLGLCEKWWAGDFTLEWMIGEKKDSYWESICRYYNKHVNTEIFSKLSSNGSKDSHFGIRQHFFSKDKLEDGWKPDVRVTVAVTSDAYKNGSRLNGTELANRVYLNIQGDFIDDLCGDSGLNSKIRHFKDMSRVRIIVYPLSDKVKKISDFGLNLGHLKKNSGFYRNGAIFLMVQQTISNATKYFDDIRSLYEGNIGNADAYKDKEVIDKFHDCMRVDKKAIARSTKRKSEAIKFEGKIAKALTENFGNIEWDHNDSHITATHVLEGEGIDSLGEVEINNKNLWVAIQVKDKESALSDAELTKFEVTLNSLRMKYPNDNVLAYLVLAKKKGYTPDLFVRMLDKNITVIWDDLDGERTVKAISNQISILENLFGARL